MVLRQLRDENCWAQCASRLTQHTVRVYALRTERRHVESTTARADTRVSAEGVWPFGPSKADRPDWPQVKVRQAGLEPLGRPLATEVVSGERAAAPLYGPCIERV
jgi:transposase